MLTIYLRSQVKDDMSVVIDGEKLFREVGCEYNECNKNFVKLIDKGELIDDMSFIDRFKDKNDVSRLSTGCKIACCISRAKDKVIDLAECGLNARDYIVNFAKEGFIVLGNEGITIREYTSEINVRMGDYIFSSVDRLNQYISNEYPYAPKLDGGVKHV